MHKNKSVRYYRVTSEDVGQRIDNLLLKELKGLPKSRIYRLLRKGEVRVNKKRIDPAYRLQLDDSIRIPPVFLAEKAKFVPPSKDTINLLKEAVIYEDDDLLVINKPSGMSVHSGNTVRMGVIEVMRHLYPKLSNLELAHRIDAGTSGCLVLAKRKSALREMHELLREGKVEKRYIALTKGKWKKTERFIDVPLHKSYEKDGKKVVNVDQKGKRAVTEVTTKEVFAGASLVEVSILTGRTHQIRVHTAHMGHPIAGDDRYGDKDFNKLARGMGLKRLFLHAYEIAFTLPKQGKKIELKAPLAPELEEVIMAFKAQSVRK